MQGGISEKKKVSVHMNHMHVSKAIMNDAKGGVFLCVYCEETFQLSKSRSQHVRNQHAATKPGSIMLFKLPIMLLSNAPKFSLLCLNYAPLYPVMLHKFIKLLLP